MYGYLEEPVELWFNQKKVIINKMESEKEFPKNIEEQEDKVEFSEAKPQDVLGITEVLYRTWLDTYPNEEYGITVEDIEDKYKDAFSEEKLQERALKMENEKKGDVRILAKENDRIVGLVRIVKHEDKNELQAIYVHPEFQKKGIGMKLWENVKERLDPDKDTIVSVAVYNQNAIDFYKKLGFEKTGKFLEEEKLRLKSGAIIPTTEMVMKRSR